MFISEQSRGRNELAMAYVMASVDNLIRVTDQCKMAMTADEIRDVVLAYDAR